MDSRRFVRGLAAVCLLVVGLSVIAGAVAGADTATSAPVATQSNETGENGTGVGVGQQLATVVSVSRHEVGAGVEDASFESAYERANESRRAGLLATRTAALLNRSASLRATHRALRASYEAGEIGTLTFAQRSAVLSARANNLAASIVEVRARTRNVPEADLRAAGLNATALDTAAERVERVTGAGHRAMLARFVGERDGEIEIEAEGPAMEIAVESEDGERSREFERERDDDAALTVDRETALTAARDALGTVDGEWVLTSSEADRDDGVYAFAFVVESNTTAGEAEVAVDGSTGEVFELEEEVERRDGDDDDAGADAEADSERDTDEDETETAEDTREDGDADEVTASDLTLTVTNGTPEPGATVEITVRADGEPVGNVTVTRDGEPVGTTDADGRLRVTLPREDTQLEAEYGGADGELRFEFDDEADESDTTDETDGDEADGDEEAADETTAPLAVDAVSDDGTVTLTVTHDGTAVSGVAVEADGDEVGLTDEDGRIAFPMPDDDEFDVELTAGDEELERTYILRDGSLVPVED